MTYQEELKRLREGGGIPPQAILKNIVSFIVYCPDNADLVLHRTKEVLEIILEQDPNNWPSAQAWRSLLPNWFVRRSSEEISQEEAEKRLQLPLEERMKIAQIWSVSAFVYWFQPDERHWFWWDAIVEGDNTIRVALIAEDWPFPWGSLEWLFRVSGATRIEEE